MGQRTIYVDDLDGSELGADEDATVTFALQGRTYSIDLSAKNRAALEKALEKYVAAATLVSERKTSFSSGRGKGRGRGRSSSSAPKKSESELIREWAASEGIEVSPRGRISAAVREQYLAATKGKKK